MGEGGVKASWGNLGLKSLGSSQLHGLTRIKNFMPNQRKCHTATILESWSQRITTRLWELFMNHVENQLFAYLPWAKFSCFIDYFKISISLQFFIVHLNYKQAVRLSCPFVSHKPDFKKK